jgi:CubicO group peptidase (beta-lactamase class C family)
VNTRSFAGLCLALVVGLSARPLHAQSPAAYAEAPAPTHYGPAIDYARLIIDAIMEESGTPGMSVAVGIDGSVVWSRGFGYADVENRTPVWEQTKFRIGSVSKPVTAAAVALLVEQGKLDLDAPVQRYVPSFPEKRWPITTRQLAGHLSGVRHYNGDEFLSSRRYETVLEGLAIFQEDTLLFEPGERFSYSSYAWNLMSAVVEGASGEAFLTYMQENVFGPLDMRHTVAGHTDSIIPHRTRFYDRNDDGSVLNGPYVDNSYKWAGGGFLSTPEDLVRFGMAHLDGAFLKPETVELLWATQHTNEGEATEYGIGWSVVTEGGRARLASHGGGSVGGTTFLLILPEERAVLAIVGNMSQAPTGPTPSRLILNAFLEPTSLRQDAPSDALDIAGSFACTASVGDREVGEAELKISGEPGNYWGRVAWANGTEDRLIYTNSRSGETEILAVDENGALTAASFTGLEGGLLTGWWMVGDGRGDLVCTSN